MPIFIVIHLETVVGAIPVSELELEHRPLSCSFAFIYLHTQVDSEDIKPCSSFGNSCLNLTRIGLWLIRYGFNPAQLFWFDLVQVGRINWIPIPNPGSDFHLVTHVGRTTKLGTIVEIETIEMKDVSLSVQEQHSFSFLYII